MKAQVHKQRSIDHRSTMLSTYSLAVCSVDPVITTRPAKHPTTLATMMLHTQNTPGSMLF